jgi:hypothetical protein
MLETIRSIARLMKLKYIARYAVIVACCLFAGGCFTVEQEIFLNADGSGQLVVFISPPIFSGRSGS